MSREIIEAVRTIEREKGIEEDTLIHALEDALLAAYKKTPESSRHATVELDTESGASRNVDVALFHCERCFQITFAERSLLLAEEIGNRRGKL